MSDTKNPERIFIHAIMNPLTVIKFENRKILKTLEEKKDLAEIAERMGRIKECADKIEELATARRKLLIEQDQAE